MEEIRKQIIESLQNIHDEEALQQFAKSLKKLEKDGKNELADLKSLKAERKELRAEKGKVYDIVSYHLGSPLRTMRALTDMLRSDSDRLDRKGILEFSNHLSSQIAKLQELMGNFIAWSSLEVKNFVKKEELLDLSQLVQQVAAKQQPNFERKQVSFQPSIAEGISVVGDREMLATALENLLSNALKFSLKGGSVTLTLTAADGQAQVEIRDSGIGMGKAKLANIFNPSRKATQKGTANELGLGMGLIVAKAYLALHHSELRLESEQGEGTTAQFALEEAAS